MKNPYTMLVPVDGGYSSASVFAALSMVLQENANLRSRLDSAHSILAAVSVPSPALGDADGVFEQRFSTVAMMERLAVHGREAWVDGYDEPFDWVDGRWVQRGTLAPVGGESDAEAHRSVRPDELVHRDDGVADGLESDAVRDGGQAAEGQYGAEDEIGAGS